jgi:N-acetylgalactosamine-N,N'-diacetylbacillosaminyl-diphospho-undecaprenol 4-alpha-N-acetylgalactosaminyltransferase
MTVNPTEGVLEAPTGWRQVAGEIADVAVRKRRVTFIINSLVGHGAERVMSTLLSLSHAECEEFDVSLALLDNEPDEYEIPEAVSVHRLGCGGSAWRTILQLSRLLARQRPDVTLSFVSRANVANVLAQRGPRVISARINTSAGLRAKQSALMRTGIKLAYPHACKIIAVSDDVALDLCANFGVNAARVITIPNPVDIEGIKRQARAASVLQVEAPYIVAVGRLVPVKNFALLLRAVALSGLPHKLVLLGEGPERERLLQTAGELGLGDRVILPGRLPNPFPLMAGAEVFALSSNGEGFPNALVEAMALGVAAVATDCPSGPSEILANARRGEISAATVSAYGILTPPDDDAQFAAALSLAVKPEIRGRLRVAGAMRVAQYDPVRIKDAYWSVLRELMDKRS